MDPAGYLQELVSDGRRVFPVRRAIQMKSFTSSFFVFSLLTRCGDVSNISDDDVDEQYCRMKFGSWTFNGRQLTLEWYEDYRQVISLIISQI